MYRYYIYGLGIKSEDVLIGSKRRPIEPTAIVQAGVELSINDSETGWGLVAVAYTDV